MLENEGRRRKKKKLVKKGLGPWHGRATTGTGRANLLEKWMWWVWFLVNGFKKILLCRIIFGQIPTKQIKTTQNKQNKSNKTRGLPPTKRSFKVISLTVRRRFLYPIPNLSQRDKGIKLVGVSPRGQ